VVGLPLRNSVLAGMPLGQVGEFSLVAAKSGVAVGLLDPSIFQSVLDVAVLSMIATPLMVAAAPQLAAAACRTPLLRLQRNGIGVASPAAAGPCGGHVLIIGFGVTGRNLAHAARATGVPYAVVEMNAGIVRRALQEGEPIRFGDATHEAILRLVHADQARAIAVVIDDAAGARRIVELCRRFAPGAYILVRTRYLREVEALMGIGADEVIADELEVSIEVFSRILARMLVPRAEIKDLISEVRGRWRRMARDLSTEATSLTDLRRALPNLATHTLRLDAHSPLVGESIAGSRLRAVHGVTVLAVIRQGRALGNPRGETLMERGDLLFVIGPEDWDPATAL
jgi:CPA2 family monovalent cation:H+ antiporter-2